MAIGDLWNDSVDPSGDSGLITEDGLGEEIPAPEAAETKPRLSLAKVSPAEAKHRGANRRRAAAELHAGVALGELDDVDAAMRRRNDILVAAIKRTQELYIVTDQRQIFRLAAADLFVERAQLVLAQRSRTMWRSGIVCTAAAVALLIGLSAFLVWRAQAVSSASLTGYQLTLGLVEMVASALIVAVTVRYLIKLSSSFFQENVSAVAKQHGLGFGRLYVYTNPEAVRLKDLQDAFGLDLDSTPIFLDIKAREASDSIYSKVTQDLAAPGGR